jgi:hypothetical protein
MDVVVGEREDRRTCCGTPVLRVGESLPARTDTAGWNGCVTKLSTTSLVASLELLSTTMTS